MRNDFCSWTQSIKEWEERVDEGFFDGGAEAYMRPPGQKPPGHSVPASVVPARYAFWTRAREITAKLFTSLVIRRLFFIIKENIDANKIEE